MSAGAEVGVLHECPAPTCTKQVPRAHLVCEPHWFALPYELRDRISRTWRVQNLPAHRRACAEAVRYLQEVNPL